MHWPLFEAYPALARELDPLALCELPTPVQALSALGANAWIKRDDISHPRYGGNKMRKLEFVAAEIRRRGARRLYTFGATGTNAGVAAALMCQELRLACTIFTFEQPASPLVATNQARMRRYGARLVHLGPLWAAAAAWYLHPRRLDPRSYFLFAGGSNPVAVFGYVNAAFELREQVRRGECPLPAEIVVAAGSTGTLAGLTLGCELAGLATRVIGVRVSTARLGPFPACAPATVRRMMRQAAQRVAAHGYAVAVPEPDLRDDWFGDGYGVTNESTQRAIARGAELGIALEQTYTGKAFAAFLDRLAVQPGPVMFWDTFNSRDDGAGRGP